MIDGFKDVSFATSSESSIHPASLTSNTVGSSHIDIMGFYDIEHDAYRRTKLFMTTNKPKTKVIISTYNNDAVLGAPHSQKAVSRWVQEGNRLH